MSLAHFRNQRVLLTGHTGFKGSWLAEWLLNLGAKVTGYSLAPPTDPSLFQQIGLASRLDHRAGDVRDLPSLTRVVHEVSPRFVFHLAAQPLVRQSYQEPLETFATNVMGTVNLLEALRETRNACIVVVVTTDKCYENHGQKTPYTEEEGLGGRDPYSSSKACAELVVSAYRRSFCSAPIGLAPALATARAGNVLGGGDWAADRILPDCVRSLQRGQSIAVRNPTAIRPWQHVLEPLSGYLVLAAELSAAQTAGDFARVERLTSPFNFGPTAQSNQTVSKVVEDVLREWPGQWENKFDPHALHEEQRLQLSIAKADRLLGWRPVWNFERAITESVRWYRRFAEKAGSNHDQSEVARFTREQIENYTAEANRAQLAWAGDGF